MESRTASADSAGRNAMRSMIEGFVAGNDMMMAGLFGAPETESSPSSSLHGVGVASLTSDARMHGEESAASNQASFSSSRGALVAPTHNQDSKHREPSSPVLEKTDQKSGKRADSARKEKKSRGTGGFDAETRSSSSSSSSSSDDEKEKDRAKSSKSKQKKPVQQQQQQQQQNLAAGEKPKKDKKSKDKKKDKKKSKNADGSSNKEKSDVIKSSKKQQQGDESSGVTTAVMQASSAPSSSVAAPEQPKADNNSTTAVAPAAPASGPRQHKVASTAPRQHFIPEIAAAAEQDASSAQSDDMRNLYAALDIGKPFSSPSVREPQQNLPVVADQDTKNNKKEADRQTDSSMRRAPGDDSGVGGVREGGEGQHTAKSNMSESERNESASQYGDESRPDDNKKIRIMFSPKVCACVCVRVCMYRR